MILSQDNMKDRFIEGKIEGIREIVKFLEKELKVQKETVEKAKENWDCLKYFDDCCDVYREGLMREEAKFNILLEAKISIEKYWKKLKHEQEESYTEG